MSYVCKAGLRPLGRLVAGAALATLTAVSAIAQEVRAPEGPIEFTVGTSPGGTPDVLMRQAAQLLNELGIVEAPIVVQNRTGGSWAVAGTHAVGQDADPNTVMVIAQPLITTPITQGIDTFYDKLTPLGMFIQGGLTLAVQPDAPYNTLAEMVAFAEESGTQLRVAGAQAGSTDHLVTALVEEATGLDINYIPYDGGGAALASFLGGNVELVVLPPVEALPHVQTGDAKLIALLSEERRTEAEFADLPTAREQGFEIVWGQAWGLAGAPNLDPAYVVFWEDAITRLLATPEWQAFVAESYLTSEYGGTAMAREELEAIHKQHADLLTELGLAKM